MQVLKELTVAVSVYIALVALICIFFWCASPRRNK